MIHLISFIKNYTLPIAMAVGIVIYFALSGEGVFSSAKPLLKNIAESSMPILIFLQLLLSFCKTNPKELLPKIWHLWLILFQVVSCFAIASILLSSSVSADTKIILEGAMVCLICPTATAAVVITGKLGGNTGVLVAYTIVSNIVAAIVIPLLFPLVEPHAELGFITSFLTILSRVFPLLISPLILALLIRYFANPLHAWLVKHSGMAFYIWAVALTIVTAQTVAFIANSTSPASIKVWIAVTGLITCIVQFAFGKYIGNRYNNKISAGQALGQKNTILAIWLASTYLNPLSSVAAGSYVIWQNCFNSWQLWRARRK